jgi:GT2 family glycosyltransferase
MRVVLSGVGTSLEGWYTVALSEESTTDERAAALAFLDARGDSIDELLVVACLERNSASYARDLLERIAERLPSGASVTFIVPDVAGALEALNHGESDTDEVEEWFGETYGAAVDPWCAGPRDVAAIADQVGLGVLEPVELTPDLPPGLGVWRTARRVVLDAHAVAPRDGSRGEPHELHVRVRRLAAERRQARVATPRSPDLLPPMSRSRLRQIVERLLPRGGRKRAAARASVDALRETRDYVDRVRGIVHDAGLHEPRSPSYRRFLREHDASTAVLTHQRALAETSRHGVTVSCIVLARGSRRDTQSTLESLRQQTWPHWRAVVVGPNVGWSRDDGHVRFVRGGGGDAASAVNAVLDDADPRGLVLVLESGDRLAPDACFRIADAAGTDPLVDLVSWDDDILDGGRRSDPRFRPSWSPEMLLGANYLGRSFALRRRLLVGMGGLRSGLGEDAWWDLLLRADLTSERVARIPHVLGHLRRRVDGVGPRGVDVVQGHLDRIGASARAESGGECVRVVWDDEDLPHVTIIIPTRHNTEMLLSSLGGVANTDYPSLDVIVVDNGGRTDERTAWYAESFPDLDLEVEWWHEEFNYSAVNNAAAARARGDVLVFVNDDTAFPDPSWLRELVGWARRPEIGVVGLQLVDEEGRIQHGGVILGLNGFADHLFEGMAPGSPTLLGSTTWYRNVLSVTAACLAIRRSLFEDLGGFDERFRLCGSDVVLGLDAVLAGKRNVCSPFGGVRHLESATRGTYVPPEDYFASFWRYQRWIFAGDPYFSPCLSLGSRVPALRARFERTPAARISEPLGRQIKIFRQSTDESEVNLVARGCRITDSEIEAVHQLHANNAEPFAPKTINWFLPELDSPFYGGINTALRIADHLTRVHGVENRFVIWARANEGFHRSAIAAAFPGLADSPIYYDLSLRAAAGIPASDISISTLWVTAYVAAHFANTRRKFYLVQDFEPMFYAAGTMYGLAEESYRLGLYGLCNTQNLLDLYRRYGGQGTSFVPAVDRNVFHAVGRRERASDDPVTVFVYARPGHWRNCWELASLALEELKDRLGDRVRIVTAGSWARPEDVGTGIQHLGLLDYRETGNLYRTCDVGVALTVSEHPSYLPLELMASGVAVVAFDNPAGHWLLRDNENCLLTRRTSDDLCRQLERVVLDHELRRALAGRGLRDIDESYSSWDKALSGIYEYLSDPEGAGSG